MSNKIVDLARLSRYDANIKRVIDKKSGDATVATFNIVTANTTIALTNLTGFTSIDWGDGTVNALTSHKYTAAGTYQCSIYDATSLGDNSFSSVGTVLTSIRVGSSVTSIGDGAFDSLLNLSTILLPEGLTRIGLSAFHGCNISEIVIPDSVVSLDTAVFENCRNLVDVTISKGLSVLPVATFFGCLKLKKLVIPENITYIYPFVFDGCDNLTELIMESATPPTLASDSLSLLRANNGRIRVPIDSLSAYRTAINWIASANYIVALIDTRYLDNELLHYVSLDRQTDQVLHSNVVIGDNNVVGGEKNLYVSGDLYVYGTSHIVDEETIQSQANIIVTNSNNTQLPQSGGTGVVSLTGSASGDEAYAVAYYNKLTDSVQIGLGTYANGEFQFVDYYKKVLVPSTAYVPGIYYTRSGSGTAANPYVYTLATGAYDASATYYDKQSQGENVATRSDSDNWQDTEIPQWDAQSYSFISSKTTTNDFVKKVLTDANIAYGKSGGGEFTWPISSPATQFTLALRDIGGVLNVGTPTANTHATTKLYVDTLDGENVKLSGAQTIVGYKTFTGGVSFEGGAVIPTNQITTATRVVNKEYLENTINALDVTDTAVTGRLVSSVSETDGKISVTRRSLGDADGVVLKGATNQTIQGVKTFSGTLRASNAPSAGTDVVNKTYGDANYLRGTYGTVDTYSNFTNSQNMFTTPIVQANTKIYTPDIATNLMHLNTSGYNSQGFALPSVANADAIGTPLVLALESKTVARSNLASIVYGTDASGLQTTLSYAEFGNSYSLVQRNNAGNVYTGTPTETWESTPKTYVDTADKAVEQSLIVMDHAVSTYDGVLTVTMTNSSSPFSGIRFPVNSTKTISDITIKFSDYASSSKTYLVYDMTHNTDTSATKSSVEGSSQTKKFTFSLTGASQVGIGIQSATAGSVFKVTAITITYTDSSKSEIDMTSGDVVAVNSTLSRVDKYSYRNVGLHIPIIVYDSTHGQQLMVDIIMDATNYKIVSDIPFDAYVMCWNDKYGGEDRQPVRGFFGEGDDSTMYISGGFKSAFRRSLDDKYWVGPY